MPRIEVQDGAEMFYGDHGTGTPLLFVHGGLMNHRVWDYQVEAFADDYRVVTVDLLGNGDSDKPYGEYSAERYAEHLHTLLAELDLQDVRFVGWSLGATIGTTYMHEYGDRIAKLVLCSTGLFHYVRHAGEDSHEGLDVERLMDAHRENHPASTRPFVEGMFGPDIDDDTVEWFWQLAMQTPLHVALEQFGLYARMDYERARERLTEIDIPTAIFQGRHDNAAEIADAEWITTELLQEGTSTGFTESGHAPFIEETEKFNDVLRAFIG